jgi:hypothetical protein
MNTTCALIPAVVAAVASTAGAQIVDHDLFLISAALANPAPPPSALSGVMRIDPVTGQTTIIASNIPGFRGRGSYDPYRQRIVASVIVGNPLLVASDGTWEELPLDYAFTPINFAPIGDGRIYFTAGAGIGWVDANGVVHTLMDETGQAPFQLAPTLSTGGFIYHVLTNSLFYADGDPSGQTSVEKIPLTLDGSQLAGPVQSVLYDVSSTFDEPKHFGRGPGGQLILVVDDNSNSQLPRVLLVDPETLDVTVYATCGYFGVGGQVAGTYSLERDQAVVLDSLGDNLRLYDQGEVGEGTIWVSGAVSSPGGSGEVVQMIEIGGTIAAPVAGDLNGDDIVGVADFLLLLAAWGPCPEPCPPSCPADFDGDCTVGVTDFLIQLANWST